MGGDFLCLSPGEEERRPRSGLGYYQETFRRLRCERLNEVRQKEDARARELRRQFERRSKEEEKAFRTVEVRAQLEAKRAQLEGLLELRRACEAGSGAAMREAEVIEAEADAQRAVESAAEALRREEEALRSLRAARSQRKAASAQQQRAAEETQRASEIAAAERRRAQRAASLGRMAQAAKELVRREAARRAAEAPPARPLEVIEATAHAPRPAPRPTPAQKKAARARSAAAWQQAKASKKEEAAARFRAEDERKEREQKMRAVAEAAAEAAEAAQPRGEAAVAEEEISLCEDCKEIRAELERIMAYRTLSPRELRGPRALEDAPQQSCEPQDAGPEEQEQPLCRSCDSESQGMPDIFRESCESENLELPAVSAQIMLPGLEISAELESQSGPEPESPSHYEGTDEVVVEECEAAVEEIRADLPGEGAAARPGESPELQRPGTTSLDAKPHGQLPEAPSSSGADSCDHETAGPSSSPQANAKERLTHSSVTGCSALCASLDSVSTASEPRTFMGAQRFGEEDLSRRLDEICRQFDAVF